MKIFDLSKYTRSQHWIRPGSEASVVHFMVYGEESLKEVIAACESREPMFIGKGYAWASSWNFWQWYGEDAYTMSIALFGASAPDPTPASPSP